MLSLVLALGVGVGAVPLPDSVRRFPDSSYYPGVGATRDAQLLEAIRREAGEELLTRGPGPEGLLRRFLAGALNAEERVAALLAGAFYHDPVLLPAYTWALEKGSHREKVAAVVGLFLLVGERPPAPSSIPAQGKHWQELAAFSRQLQQATRVRSLVGIWIDSYLAAMGLPHRPGIAFRRDGEQCLAALGELAAPEDLAELAALWPLLAKREHRSRLVRIFEALLLQQFVPSPGPRGVTGPWQMEAAVGSVDAWIQGLCGTPDGIAIFYRTAEHLGGGNFLAGCHKVIGVRYPSVWPWAAHALTAQGAPAVLLLRHAPEAPQNQEAIGRLRQFFRQRPLR